MIEPKNARGRDEAAAGLAAPARHALLAAGYTRQEQLSRAREKEIAGLNGLGPEAPETIRSALRAAGLSPSRGNP